MSYDPEIIYKGMVIAGAIGSIAGGIAGIAMLIELKKQQTEGNIMKKRKMKTLAALCPLLIFLGCSLLVNVYAKAKGLDEQLVTKAWKQIDNGNCPEAIKLATECIIKFEDRAFQKQYQLQKGGTPLPPVGQVSKQKKEEIFQMGLINNVGAALFIVADCHRKAGNLDKAKSAYEKLSKLTYARVYDPSWDGFWDPSEEAGSMLKKLE